MRYEDMYSRPTMIWTIDYAAVEQASDFGSLGIYFNSV